MSGFPPRTTSLWMPTMEAVICEKSMKAFRISDLMGTDKSRMAVIFMGLRCSPVMKLSY